MEGKGGLIMCEVNKLGYMQHDYDVKTCPFCKKEFCFACCADTNVHHGGKYEQDYMLCPSCGTDYYSVS
jgi:hypothetical protein